MKYVWPLLEGRGGATPPCKPLLRPRRIRALAKPEQVRRRGRNDRAMPSALPPNGRVSRWGRNVFRSYPNRPEMYSSVRLSFGFWKMLLVVSYSINWPARSSLSIRKKAV